MVRKTLLALLLVVVATTVASAQISVSYTDSLAVTTTAATKTLTYPYISVTIVADGCDIYLRWASSTKDTTGWADMTGGKENFKLHDGSALSITQSGDLGIPGVRKIWYKAVSGTGTLRLTGFKRTYGE